MVIYSNADDEAVAAMTDTLNDNGYEGKFIFQSFGTSELGGKLLAEGTDIEAHRHDEFLLYGQRSGAKLHVSGFRF